MEKATSWPKTTGVLGVWTAGSHAEGVPQNGMYIRGKESCWKGPGKRGGAPRRK